MTSYKSQRGRGGKQPRAGVIPDVKPVPAKLASEPEEKAVSVKFSTSSFAT